MHTTLMPPALRRPGVNFSAARPSAATLPGKNIHFGAYQDPTPDTEVIKNVGPLALHMLQGAPIPPDSMRTLKSFVDPLLAKNRKPFIGPVSNWLVGRIFKGDRLPLLDNRFRITDINFPAEEKERLRANIGENSAVFLAPNHPEFMTDWLLDKYIAMQVAPYMASFAAHSIVEGAFSDLWLRHNLIGDNGGERGMDYAVNWAMEGRVTNLHPERMVRWNGNVVCPIFPGVAEMAVEAAERAANGAKNDVFKVYIQSPIWKLAFNQDVSKGLHKDMADLEKRLLGRRIGKSRQSPAGRLYQLQQNLLTKRYRELGLTEPAELHDAPYFQRAEAFMQALYDDVRENYDIRDDGPLEKRIYRLSSQIKDQLKALPKSPENAEAYRQLKADNKKVQEMFRLRDFAVHVYGREKTITQEEIAEILKATRKHLILDTDGKYSSIPEVGDRIRKGLDGFALGLPKPAGDRTAYIRVTEPIEVRELWEQAKAEGQLRPEFVETLRARVQAAMQDQLDELNKEIDDKAPRVREPNPFRIQFA